VMASVSRSVPTTVAAKLIRSRSRGREPLVDDAELVRLDVVVEHQVQEAVGRRKGDRGVPRSALETWNPSRLRGARGHLEVVLDEERRDDLEEEGSIRTKYPSPVPGPELDVGVDEGDRERDEREDLEERRDREMLEVDGPEHHVQEVDPTVDARRGRLRAAARLFPLKNAFP